MLSTAAAGVPCGSSGKIKVQVALAGGICLQNCYCIPDFSDMNRKMGVKRCSRVPGITKTNRFSNAANVFSKSHFHRYCYH